MGDLKTKDKKPEADKKSRAPKPDAKGGGGGEPAKTASPPGGNALVALDQVKPLDDTERANQVKAGRDAKRNFDQIQIGPTIIERYAGKGAPCGLHACHAEPAMKFTTVIHPIDLEGRPRIPFTDLQINEIWLNRGDVVAIPVVWGKIAKGHLSLVRNDYDELDSNVPYAPQALHFFHPALPPRTGMPPAMLIDVTWGNVTGLLGLVDEYIDSSNAQKFVGLEDFHELEIGTFKNEIKNGRLAFGLEDMKFALDGVFPAKASFDLERAKPLVATAEIEATGVAKQAVDIERDRDGLLSADKQLNVALDPPKSDGAWNGNITARFARGVYDIRGTIDYASPKGEFKGTATFLLTDKRSAWAAINQRLGAAKPVTPSPSASEKGMALVGWGVLDFDFSKWLRGSAEVVVDPDGYITTRGRLNPNVEFVLFEHKPVGDANKLYGTSFSIPEIPLVGDFVKVEGGFDLDATAWYGPAKLGSIFAEGVYSTNPQIPTEFTVGATLTLPAQAKLVLKVWGGIKAGLFLAEAGIRISLTGTATLNAYAEATPKIARRRVAGAKDTSTEYAIFGNLDFAAALDCALKGEIELHALHKTWKTIDLGGRTWRVADFGVRVMFDHVIGSGKLPSVRFGNDKSDVTFNDYKFMAAAVRDETPAGSEAESGHTDKFTPKASSRDLPEARVPTPGAADTGPVAGTQAAGALDGADQPVKPQVREAATGDTPAKLLGDAPVETATFEMDHAPHTLTLAFEHPPRIYMASPKGDQLSKKIAVALRAVKDQIKTAGPDDHSLPDLQQEERVLEAILSDCTQVELAAARLGLHPHEQLPAHVPGFTELASRLRAYGTMFDRKDLLESLAAKTAPGVPTLIRPPGLPPGKTPKLDELERLMRDIEPDIANRYAREHAAYLGNGGEMDMIPYVEGRAARRIGKVIEPTMLQRFKNEYGKASRRAEFGIHDPANKDPKKRLRHRIPDLYVDDFAVGDVKDTLEMSLDEQMRDDLLIGVGGDPVTKWPSTPGSTDWEPLRAPPLKFFVIVRAASHLQKPTRVYGPLERAAEESGGKILYWIRDPAED